MSLSSRDSEAIYIARGIAMLSVVAAHVNVLDNSTVLRTYLTSGISYLGQLGVIIFLITGGFLYHREAHDDHTYIRRKLRTLVLPWIVCSVVTYALSALASGEASILKYLRWAFGSGTWYYYFTVYIICLCAFKWIWEKDIALIVCVFLTGVSLYFGEDLLPRMGYNGTIITPYLNIFNWIGFFALGILIRRKLYTLKANIPLLIAASLITIFGCVGLYIEGTYSYFSLCSYIFEIGGGFA